MNKSKTIIVTQADYNKLMDLIQSLSHEERASRPALKELESELQRAEVTSDEDVPDDTITLNSRAILEDVQSKDQLDLTVVMPEDADIDTGKISILAPLGTAMLGYRVGDEFEWEIPAGRTRYRIVSLAFQPEADKKN